MRPNQSVTRGPLTFQQLFLWNYHGLESGESRRNTTVFRIVGSVDSGLLARSFNEVVRRHESLRTRIVMTGRTLEQHVDDAAKFNLEVIDLAELAQNDRVRQAEKFIHDFARRRCELAVGPLTGAALIRMSINEQLFAWAIHHIISDGIGTGIVLAEMWSVYAEFLHGRPPQLTRLPVRYLDYALWQHATHNDWLQKHESYWKERMADAARAQWPSGTCTASAERANAMSEVDFELTPLADLRRMARTARTTPAMVMLTVYAALVSSWCEQSVLTIPVNVAGRHRPEHEHAAGYFAQFLYLRVEVTGNETFRGLLAKITAEFREALMHQDFGKVAAHAPEVLAGSLFSWLPWNRNTFGLPALSVSSKLDCTVQQFPFAQPTLPLYDFRGIGAFFFEAEKQYSTSLWYRTDVFSASTVRRFALELRSCCQRVMANPHCPVRPSTPMVAGTASRTPEPMTRA